MNRLSPEAQRLFQLARDAHNPDAAQTNRVGRALAERVAAGGALATGAALLSLSARAGAALSATKVVTTVLVAGAVSVSGFLVVHSRNQSVAHAPPAVAGSSSASSLPTPVVSSTSSAEPIASAANANVPNGAARSAPTRTVTRAPSSAAATETADQLRAETADLHRAQAALRSGDTALALRLLDAQDSTYRGGLLQQERSAARVLALCQNGNAAAARAESAQFEKRWPNSPLASRVRSACRE